MSEDEIKGAFKFGGMPVVKHEKTGGIYYMKKILKLKNNGEWGYGVVYRGIKGTFCRDIGDFSGFTYLYNETGLKE